jgi:hypothetical protein
LSYLLFASSFTVYLIINVILLRNLPNRMINIISVHFFNTFTCCKFCPLVTDFVHSTLFSPFSLICVMILLLFLYLLKFILTHPYIPFLFVLCPFPSNHTYILFRLSDKECLMSFQRNLWKSKLLWIGHLR